MQSILNELKLDNIFCSMNMQIKKENLKIENDGQYLNE